MNKKLIILLIVAAVIALVALFFGSMKSAGILWQLSNGGRLLLPLIAAAAIVDSVNPCAFSILLVTMAFLFSLGKLRSYILKIGGLYILGILVVYIFIGLGITQALHIFNTPHFMAKLGASILIAFGFIGLLIELFPAFPIKLKIPDAAHRKIAGLMEVGSAPAAFALGALVGLCEFPCTGGPYLMVLGLLHDQATYIAGLGYLIFYNLIFIFPLVVILLIASNKPLLEKVQEWRNKEIGKFRLWTSVAMILLGLVIFAF